MVGKRYRVELTFTEPLLGTVPQNPELYRDYIQSKAPEPEAAADEVETLDVSAEVERGTTGFHKVDGKPILYNYTIKGFFKDACGMLRRADQLETPTLSSKLTNYKKVIDGLLFVSPRRVPIQTSGEVGILERPLRASTPQGERTALVRSETVPEQSKAAFEIEVLGTITEALLREWLDYGAKRGLGQWRNSGWGTVSYTLTPISGNGAKP